MRSVAGTTTTLCATDPETILERSMCAMKTLVTPLDTRLHSIVVTRNALEPIPGVEAEVGLPLVGVKKSLGGQKGWTDSIRAMTTEQTVIVDPI